MYDSINYLYIITILGHNWNHRYSTQLAMVSISSDATRLRLVSRLAIASVFICVSIASASNILSDEYSIVRENQIEGVVSEERVLELFRRWREKHGKVYLHAGEMEMRLENFKKNLKYVIQKSRDSKGHSLGLNKFADLSNQEYQKMYLKKGIKKPAAIKRWDNRMNRKSGKDQRRRKVETCEAAAALDWRNYGIVTAIKDQGQCGEFLFPSHRLTIYSWL